ncbi:hypothetical protein PRZ48_000359 [Zasmidium cellare]|uniref:Ketoreductase domain-containing protein n=1 Tax=Zasmidium cellare TaxID=395010 RepID=A0ABR0EYK8_ZASCE|nr:hypothetical protein PRZ48_000359 [Zasmidium cellare]
MAKSTSRLEGITAMVTGSSSGIGRAVALQLATEGAKAVICVDVRPGLAQPRSNEDALPTHEVIQSRHGNEAAAFMQCDISVEEDGRGETLGVANVMRNIAELTGRIDVLVNCAGIGLFGYPLHETSLEIWQKQMDVCATGSFLMMKHSIAQFLKQEPDQNGSRGSIVNISSIGAKYGLRGCGAYCAAKAALLAVSRSAAVDYAAQGIRINVILPGYIQTPMLQPVLDDRETHAGFEEYLNSSIPAGRLGQPRDIAGAAVWLASSAESAYVTGSTFTIDGGFTAV